MPNGRSSRTGEERTGRPVPTLAPANAVPPAGQPRELSDAELTLAGAPAGRVAGASAPTGRPVLAPPGTTRHGSAAVADAATRSVRVLAVFSSSAHSNSWAFLEGTGWKRLATTNDSGHLALGILASAARIQGTAASVRYENDDQIHEIYVW